MATAEYIAKILGGAGSIRMMTGCKVYALDNDEGLVLADLPNNKYNFVTIKYNIGTDLFDVNFKKSVRFKITNSKDMNDIYIDQLKHLVESETGLYLTF